MRSMHGVRFRLAGLVALVALLSVRAASAQDLVAEAARRVGTEGPRARLMYLGVFHFANPGRDVHKRAFQLDMLSPERQRQIDSLVTGLAAYRPTRVAVEADPDQQPRLDSLYREYRAGRWALPANEVYQIGFRLAARLGLPGVNAVDADPAEVFQPIFQELEQHEPDFASADPEGQRRFERLYAYEDTLTATLPLSEFLRYANSPERIAFGHGAYAVGWFTLPGKSGYLGADFRAAWYDRNLRIFRNLQRLTGSPDERILLVIGAGHLPILRFLTETSPEYRLEDVVPYLKGSSH